MLAFGLPQGKNEEQRYNREAMVNARTDALFFNGYPVKDLIEYLANWRLLSLQGEHSAVLFDMPLR